MNEELDPQAVMLAKAIRHVESGGNFNARGKSGEYGAYQYTKDTWNNDAKRFGINKELEQATPEEQNEVAYRKIKELKDQGHDVGQVASIWNSGKPDWQGNVGTNKYGVEYDTPKYVNTVASTYQAMKEGKMPDANPQTSSTVQEQQATPQEQGPDASGYYTQAYLSPKTENAPTPGQEQQEKTLGQELQGRAQDISGAAQVGAEGLGDIYKGNYIAGAGHLASSALQGAGALAGGVNDVVNKVVESIPVVGDALKGVEKLVGKGFESLAGTDTGKKVLSIVKEQMDKHPELAKDIEAGINILSVIPVLKGLGLVKNIAADAAASSFKNTLEKSAVKGLSEVAAKYSGGRDILREAPDAIETIIKERALPDVENGIFATAKGRSVIDKGINQSENALQEILKSASNSGVKPVINLREARNKALQEATASLEGQAGLKPTLAKINEIFDAAEQSKKAIEFPSLGKKSELGKSQREVFMKLEDANFFKRQARKGIEFDDKVAQKAGFHVGQSYMNAIEKAASDAGIQGVTETNKRLGQLIRGRDFLEFLEGKNPRIKQGLVGKIIDETGKDVASVAGETVGRGFGVPFAGAISARGMAGAAQSVTSGAIKRNVVNSLLKRTGKEAVRVTGKEAARKSAGLVGTLLARKVQKRADDKMTNDNQ